MHLNLTDGVTSISHDIYWLHMTALLVCAGIGVIVFSVLIYSIIYHRQSNHTKPAKFHEHLWIELTWTIIPFLILVGLAIPATQILSHINHNIIQPDLTVVVTGYQWKWKYEYLNQGVSYFSHLSTPADQLDGRAPKNLNYLREVDQPLVLPIHKKVHFLITSNDVIHAWWVPEFGIKRDAVPGFINEAWVRINRPGIYRGQCAELCGINHAFMPIVVKVTPEKEFENWITTQKTGIKPMIEQPTPVSISPPATPKKLSPEQLIAKGKNIYLNTCAACHKPDGSGMPPVFPSLITSQILKGPVDKHLHIVIFGVPGTAMQAFGQQLSPEDMAAVITYERHVIGNYQRDIVKPEDVIAAEKRGPPS